MNYRQFFKIQFFALLFVAAFTACNKDEVAQPTPIEGEFSMNNGMGQIVTRSTDDDSTGLCFEIGFPITVELPSGGSLTANNLEELETIYNDWFENNPGDSTCPAIVYPINVVLEDGTTQSVASEEALVTLLEDCIDIDLGWEDCFQINYPLTVAYPDGSSLVVNSDEDLGSVMNSWYEDHPNDTLYPVLAFPISVTLSTGEVVEVADEIGLNTLFEDCFGTVEPPVDPVTPCFDYVFPLVVALPDGTTANADSYEALDAIFLAWFEDHPNDSIGFPTISYPLNLQLENGDIVTVNNDDEFNTIFVDCYGDGSGGGNGGGGGFEECFTFNYPFSLVLPDGTSPAVNSDDELYETILGWYEANPNDSGLISFQYPISVTLSETGDVVTVNNDEELNTILEGCFECVIQNGEGLVLGGMNSMAAKVAVKQHSKLQSKAKATVAKTIAKQAHRS